MNARTLSNALQLLVAPKLQTKPKEKTMTSATNPAPDYSAIKTKQNAAWSSGDYAKIGTTLQITGEKLAEAAEPVPGSQVLDVASGNGNATLAFARRCCAVTSTDYVQSLLDDGRVRAEAEGYDVAFQTADAEALPFEDESFDIVTSTFGVMFTPNQKQAASELIRVCRPGGKIALANWTPDSFIGALFKTLGKHVPPPAGVQSPALWGDREWIKEIFSAAGSISMTMENFNFRYMSVEHFVDFFRTFYGPVHKAFLALDEEGQEALADDIVKTIAQYNVATDGSMIVPGEYAQIVITKMPG